MINFGLTHHKWSVERAVLASEIGSMTAGHALVALNTDLDVDGEYKVARAGNSTTNIFDGIAMAPKKTFGTWRKLEEVKVPATSTYTVALSRLASGTIGAFKKADGVAVAVSTSAASPTNIQSDTTTTPGYTTLTFDSSFAGVSWIIVYAFATSAYDDTLLVGDAYPGMDPVQALSRVSVFKSGRIATNMFKTTANWFVSSGLGSIKVVDTGLFSDAADSANGVIPGNVKIVQVPTVISPWLVLDLN